MKIVLVNPRIIDTPFHPLGILYIAACLEKNGYIVEVIDPNFDDSIKTICNNILNKKPEIIGFGATTTQMDKATNIINEIKNMQKNIPIIFGGVHTTIMPKDVLKNKDVDFVVVGEAEETIVELCNAIKNKKSVKDISGIGYKEDNKLQFTKHRELISNLDKVPFPARHLLSSRWYFAPPRIRGVWTKSTATVMASRGCPYMCIYCGSHLMFGRKVRYRSVSNVIEELKHLREEFQIDSVWFADDTFTVNPIWVKEFCAELRKLRWKDFKWACQARVNTVTYDLLIEMKSAGCVQLDFGVESGSPKILKILKKGITPEMVIKAFNVTKKAGLLRFASFIIGTPEETEDDLRQTEALALKIKPDYTEFFFAVPFPGTELYDLAKKYNVFKDIAGYNEWIIGKQTDVPIMATTISREKLVKWRSRLHNQFFFRNYRTFLKNPRFILGGLKIFFLGIGGLPKGIKRFITTKKLDNIFVQILVQYRRRLKSQTQS